MKEKKTKTRWLIQNLSLRFVAGLPVLGKPLRKLFSLVWNMLGMYCLNPFEGWIPEYTYIGKAKVLSQFKFN